MSVIRQPDVLGRSTRRRVVGTTAAVFTTTIETVAIGTWFLLVVLSPRTLSATLAGVGILFCGTLLRTSVYAIATSELEEVIAPQKLSAVVFGTAGWVLWLLTAEWIGGVGGVITGGIVLASVLSVQFAFERRLFQPPGVEPPIRTACTLVPATVIALGASVLLASVWFTNWIATVSSLTLAGTQLVVQIEASQIGFGLFALGLFLAYQQRLWRSLEI